MTTDLPIACTLGAGDLQRRLAAMAALGADALVHAGAVDGLHVLRFRAGTAIRERLETIVAAEADCCPFLDIALTEDDGELVLTIAAPEEARPVAGDLARAFAGQVA
jgi:hypothetical protein